MQDYLYFENILKSRTDRVVFKRSCGSDKTDDMERQIATTPLVRPAT